MCKFRFKLWEPCKCILFEDLPQYCPRFLEENPNYKPMYSRSVWVDASRDPGVKYDSDSTHYETVDLTRCQHFNQVSCTKQRYYMKESVQQHQQPCPFHGPWELKGKWDREVDEESHDEMRKLRERQKRDSEEDWDRSVAAKAEKGNDEMRKLKERRKRDKEAWDRSVAAKAEEERRKVERKLAEEEKRESELKERKYEPDGKGCCCVVQ